MLCPSRKVKRSYTELERRVFELEHPRELGSVLGVGVDLGGLDSPPARCTVAFTSITRREGVAEHPDKNEEEKQENR